MERKGQLLVLLTQNKRQKTSGKDIVKLLKKRGVPLGEDSDRSTDSQR